MKLKKYQHFGFLGFLGFLGLTNPSYYFFFAFLLFFLPPAENKSQGNKIMFCAGLVFVVAAAILLLGNFMGESTFPTISGVLGVIFIGTSGFRLLK